MTERRQCFRRRTYLKGRIEIDRLNGWSLECAVREVSDSGARLAIPAGVIVPQLVSVTISDRPRRPAKLVWYGAGQAGFAFVDQGGSERQPASEPCRRAARDTNTEASDRLADRVAAIGRPPLPGFTCP